MAASRARGRCHAPRRALLDRCHRPSGQALVEFALLAPVMLLLVSIGLDAGRVFFTWIDVNNAAREAAAYAAGNPTDTTGITTHATQETNVQGQGGEGSVSVAYACNDPNGHSITCASATGGNGTGNTITVHVTRPFSFVTPFVSTVLGNVVTLTGSATASVFGLQPNGGAYVRTPCDPPTSATFTVSTTDMTVSVDASASTPNSGYCAIASYDWGWGDGVNLFPPIIGKQAVYTYGTSGTYTITLTVSNSGGSLSTTGSVTVPSGAASPSPSPSPTPGPSITPPPPVCTFVPSFTYTESGASGRFNFYGAYTGQPAPSIWFWSFGDGFVDYGQAPNTHTYTGTGPYTVNLTITNGQCQATVSQVVTP